MGKTTKKMITTMCCIGVLATGCVSLAQAQAPAVTEAQMTVKEEVGNHETQSSTILAGGDQKEHTGGPGVDSEAAADREMIRIWGTVLGVEEGTIRIDNQSGVSYAGEIVLNISDEYSRVLDAENGYPVEVSQIQEGDFIYAYIGPAMTMSLPPMTTAELVICQIPEDFRVPDYVRVKSMKQGTDGNWSLTTTDEAVYKVPSDCQILPYLTRNLVQLSDVTESSTCLIWTDEMENVQKIVLFAQDSK